MRIWITLLIGIHAVDSIQAVIREDENIFNLHPYPNPYCDNIAAVAWGKMLTSLHPFSSARSCPQLSIIVLSFCRSTSVALEKELKTSQRLFHHCDNIACPVFSSLSGHCFYEGMVAEPGFGVGKGGWGGIWRPTNNTATAVLFNAWNVCMAPAFHEI